MSLCRVWRSQVAIITVRGARRAGMSLNLVAVHSENNRNSRAINNNVLAELQLLETMCYVNYIAFRRAELLRNQKYHMDQMKTRNKLKSQHLCSVLT